MKIASRLWKSFRVNTVEGAILFIYAPCCSKVREEFGMEIGLESIPKSFLMPIITGKGKHPKLRSMTPIGLKGLFLIPLASGRVGTTNYVQWFEMVQKYFSHAYLEWRRVGTLN